MEAGDQQLVYTPFVPPGSWSPCAPLDWNHSLPTHLPGPTVITNPVKAPDIPFSSSQFRKQHHWCEKAVSRTSVGVALFAWPCENIPREVVDSPQGESVMLLGQWVSDALSNLVQVTVIYSCTHH
ncbi:unnamed protein product [Schistosoma margrebowiei]|uniref:Uncharacterized protein n=1 Tax=Schistosoma margrebowiei TaxID=48269 RepID=A0A183LFB7_9TREM|nr:unnamed protein product [Schistosoma margrebowiei]